MPIHQALKENPHRGEDMLVTFETSLALEGHSEKMPLRLVYIPDREILLEKDFTHWVEKISSKNWESPEALLNTLCATFYDAALPFFLDVKLEITCKNGSIHRLESIKNQPQYQVPNYLLRKI